MKLPWNNKFSVFYGILFSLLASSPTTAQIKPDTTLPHNSLVTPNGKVITIDGGTRAGNNLFHSFTQFNIPTGGTAYFNNALDVSNIFSRVTGSTVSNIDGILKANGTASLFLLNPNGIIFGKNVQLNIGGSFVGTTANAIGFGNLGIFSASSPNNPSVLTVEPSAFLFNQIAAQSISSKANLQVPNGSSLLLLGGNVSLDGAVILAPGGRVELGGLAGTGTVGLKTDASTTLSTSGTNLALTFPLEVPRADVSLSNNADVNVRADGGGSIAVNSHNLNMKGGSLLRAGIAPNRGHVGSQGGDIDINATGTINLTEGSQILNPVRLGSVGNAGNVTISASDSLNFDGVGSNGDSGVYSTVNNGAIGNAGNVSITTKSSLNLTNGGEINAGNLGNGNAGNVTISTTGLNLTNGAFIFTGTLGNGNAGNVTIHATDLNLSNGAFILTSNASSFSNGNSGDVIIIASDSIKLDGDSNIDSAFSGAKGKGGDISITSRLLNLTNGGKIIAATQGNGNAGNVTIHATDSINVDGNASNIDSSVIQGVIGNGGNILLTTGSLSLTNGAGVNNYIARGATGNGGNVTINSGSLSLTNGAFINTSTYGNGNTGNVTISATNSIKFDGNSSVNNNIVKGATGNGGNVTINSGSLSLTNGSEISTSTFGNGNSGNVTISATDSINFDGGSTVFSQVALGAKGNGGDVTINSRLLNLTNVGEITTTTYGNGNAGNVTIHASDSIKVDGVLSDGSGSGVISTVEQGAKGKGGDITITSKLLSLTNGGSINASTSGNGNAGNVTISATDSINIDGIIVNLISLIPNGSGYASGIGSQVGQGAKGKGGDITITTSSLNLTNGGQISATTFGNGNAGNLTINASDSLNLDGVRILSLAGLLTTANTNLTSSVEKGATGNGGNITITTSSLNLTNGGQISAATKGIGNAGNVIINAADSIKLDGVGSHGLSSGILNKVASGANGDGGTINITSPLFSITNGATVNAQTLKGSTGNGGSISIYPQQLTISNGSSVNVNSDGSGNGGSISIYPQQLTISNGSSVTVNSQGSGNAGNVNILQANAINLDGNTSIAATTASGEGGNITLQANSLQLRHTSPISATAGKNGNGGNLTMNANTIIALENSPITANADLGKGGNIQISTQGIFNSLVDSPITASSNAGIQNQGTVTIQILGFSATNALAGVINKFGSTEQAIAGSCIARRNVARGSFTVTGTGGLPVTPDTDAYDWYTMPLIGASPSNGAKVQSSIPPVDAASTPGWKIGDPIVEAHTMIKLPDGRVILGTIPPGVANANPQNSVCNPDKKQ